MSTTPNKPTHRVVNPADYGSYNRQKLWSMYLDSSRVTCYVFAEDQQEALDLIADTSTHLDVTLIDQPTDEDWERHASLGTKGRELFNLDDVHLQDLGPVGNGDLGALIEGLAQRRASGAADLKMAGLALVADHLAYALRAGSSIDRFTVESMARALGVTAERGL